MLLFDTTPRVFYVSEFGWVASVIFLRILQATLASQDERSFRCRRAWLAPAFGVPLLAFLLGVCVTVMCFRLRQMNREDGQNEESEDAHGAD